MGQNVARDLERPSEFKLSSTRRNGFFSGTTGSGNPGGKLNNLKNTSLSIIYKIKESENFQFSKSFPNQKATRLIISNLQNLQMQKVFQKDFFWKNLHLILVRLQD